ncbi:MAG TPA: hypothetical protein VMT24_10645 [Aggregatilineaceae bacterium]|nr:hypothetical protein [Aggregatilineaceae bacterium]
MPYTTGVLFLLALLLFVVSLRLFRRSRTDVFWRRRRDAGQRGWRLFVVAFALAALSAVSCTFTGMVMLFSKDNTSHSAPLDTAFQNSPPAPSETSAESTTVVPSPTGGEMPDTPLPVETFPSPTPMPVVVIITTTPVFTPTETLFPTFTPYATPLVSNVTPLPNAQITITGLDDQVSATLAPVRPRVLFDAGVKRIYLFVEFKGMAQGVLWKRTLYRDGELIDSSSYLWGLETEGNTYFFFGNDDGFQPGAYEIRVFIGDASAPTSSMSFIVIPQS